MFAFVAGITLPVAFSVFVALLAAGSYALSSRPALARIFDNRLVSGAAYACVAAAGLQFLYWTAGYPLIPIYFDHIEVTVAVVSALMRHGQQIYPAWDLGEGLYGMIYGPALYLIHASALSVAETIFASKLAGVLAILVALVVMALEVWRLTRRPAMVTFALGCVLLFLIKFGYFSYWNRPEPFLILLTALGISALRLSPNRAAAAIGLIAGIAFGLKPHAVLCIAPVVLASVIREHEHAAALRTGAVALACAAAVTAAPFLLPNVSLAAYLAYLKLAVGHGLSVEYLRDNAIHAVLLAAPAAVVWHLRRPVWGAETRWLALAALGCLALTAIVGAKRGSGPHHMLPFLPIALYLTIRAGNPDTRGASPVISGDAAAKCMFILYLIVLGPDVVRNIQQINALTRDEHLTPAVMNEVAAMYAAYPRAEMGVSDYQNYGWTQTRVIGVFRGTPVHLDVAYLMELEAVGLGGHAADELVDNCKVPQWILPIAGDPFSIRNLYDQDRALFSETFRANFRRNYRVVFAGRYFAVWSCR